MLRLVRRLRGQLTALLTLVVSVSVVAFLGLQASGRLNSMPSPLELPDSVQHSTADPELVERIRFLQSHEAEMLKGDPNALNLFNRRDLHPLLTGDALFQVADHDVVIFADIHWNAIIGERIAALLPELTRRRRCAAFWLERVGVESQLPLDLAIDRDALGDSSELRQVLAFWLPSPLRGTLAVVRACRSEGIRVLAARASGAGHASVPVNVPDEDRELLHPDAAWNPGDATASRPLTEKLKEVNVKLARAIQENARALGPHASQCIIVGFSHLFGEIGSDSLQEMLRSSGLKVVIVLPHLASIDMVLADSGGWTALSQWYRVGDVAIRMPAVEHREFMDMVRLVKRRSEIIDLGRAKNESGEQRSSRR